jgi:hypothetical protein
MGRSRFPGVFPALYDNFTLGGYEAVLGRFVGGAREL